MRRKFVPALVAVVAAALIALLVYGLTQQGQSRALDRAVLAHRWPAAPEATRPLPVLDHVDSRDASLDRWRGKVVVLNFWAQWCATCTAEVSLIEDAERALDASGAGTVIGVDYKDINSYALSFIAQHGMSYPNLRDIDGSFATSYGTDALPETFVLDRHLHVVAISRGEITQESWLRAAIARAERV